MQCRADGSSEGDGVPKRRDGQVRGRPRIDRVPHDPVRVNVFDGAKVELALVGPVLGDVSQPQLFKLRRREIAEHEIVVNGRASIPVQAPLLRMRGPEPLLGAQPPYPPFRSLQAGFGFDLVRDETTPEPCVVAVQIDRGVREVGVVPVALRDGVCSPFEERLLARAQHPAGHRDRHTIRGKVKDQREDHLRSDTCDRYAAALLSTSFSCSSSRMRYRSWLRGDLRGRV